MPRRRRARASAAASSEPSRARTAEVANFAARDSRRSGAPRLTGESSRGAVIDWLIWDDPNGIYTDARNEAEGWDPLTEDEAWETLHASLEEDFGDELKNGTPARAPIAPAEHPGGVNTSPGVAEAPVTASERTAAAEPSGYFIDGPHDVFMLLGERCSKMSQEEFLCLPLSTHSELLGEPTVCAMGAVDAVEVDMRDVFRPVSERNANGFVVVHWHPMMQAHPSDSDLELTKTIEKAAIAAFPGDVEGKSKAPLIDHVIMSCRSNGNGEYSNWRGGWKVVAVRAPGWKKGLKKR